MGYRKDLTKESLFGCQQTITQLEVSHEKVYPIFTIHESGI
jgi:hypothetical protein